MKVKKLIAAVAVVGTGFAVFTTGAAVQAEPVSNSYAVVGSDTIEDVLNALANGTSITRSSVRVTTPGGLTIGSFDATGGPSIITKTGGVRFSRPNGSSEGYRALSSSMLGDGVTFTDDNKFTSGTYQPALNASSTGNASMPLGLRNINIYGQVDIARSSSSKPASLGDPDVSDTVGTIARIPFGRDAFGLAFTDSLATKVCNAGQNSAVAPACVPYLNNSQLLSIFTSTVAGGPTVNVGPTGSTTPIQIQGVVPQEGSGTRSDFVSKIGTTSNIVKAATAVKLAQEHDATGLIGDEVTPMSVSRWIAMKNKVSFDRSASAVLGAITTADAGTATKPALPTTGTAPALTPNTSYYADQTWGRDTYLFVERARITKPAAGQPKGKYDENLHALVDPDVQADGFVLNNLVNRETDANSKVGKVKLMFGLLPATDVNIKFTVPKYSGTW